MNEFDNSKIEKITQKMERGFLWFWIKKYKVSLLFILLIILLWLASFLGIEKKSAPDLDLWIISITKPYIWVNPEDIDSLITQKIEREIKDISWIKKINSSSSLWFSSIVVELDSWVDVQKTMNKIKDEVDVIDFPSGSEKTVIKDITSKDNRLFSILMYGKWDVYTKDYLLEKALILRKNLEWKGSINKIDIEWWDDYEIRVLIEKAKMDELWLTISWISNSIQEYNKNTPIWNYSINNLDYDFRFEWELRSIKDFLNIPIKSTNSSIVYLKDVADIKRYFKNDSATTAWVIPKGTDKITTWYNAVSINIQKRDQDNIVPSSRSAKALLEKEFSSEDFSGLSYEIYQDTTEIMQDDYSSLFQNMMTTFALVFLTLLVFIWFKEGFIWILIVPLSYLITFIVLYYWGFSLNFLTNFSLILSLWVAIDTIIVVIEWANKKVQLGFKPKHAILVAIREYAPAIISWTMTTLAAFIPLLTLPWVMWKYLSYIPITVFITLLASLFLSLTVTSAIFMLLTKDKKDYREDENEKKTLWEKEKELLDFDRAWKIAKTWERSNIRMKIFEWLSDIYFNSLKFILSWRLIRLIFIIFPVIILFFTFKLGTWFTLFPASDNRNAVIEIEAKDGRNSESMEKYIATLEKKLSEVPEIKNFKINVSWNKISSNVELFKKDYRENAWLKNSFKVEKDISDKLEIFREDWLKVTTKVEVWWPPSGKAVWIKLVAESTLYLKELWEVSNKFEEYLKSIKWTKNTWSSTSSTPWQFVFEVDRAKLAILGLQPSQITNNVFTSTNWFTAGTIKWLNDDYDIKVKIKEFENNLSPNDVENLIINTQAWPIRIWDVATYTFKPAISVINREDTKIVVKVDADLEDWYLGSDIQPLFEKFAKKYDYPKWITYEAWWEAEENSELIVATLTAFIVALFLIFIILVLQFNSYIQPAIILYSVILALLWVNIWLWFLSIPYSMPFAIWFIALTWIVINNAIIYIDKINSNLKENLNLTDSILYAGKSRLIPMLVTTVTTVLWILPIAFQDEFWAWLWFTIVFWLVTWTAMTLFIIPALFLEVTKLSQFLWRLFSRK